MAYPDAFSAIREARERKATEMKINAINLRELPPEMFELDQVKRLSLYTAAKLTHVADDITRLSHLQWLTIFDAPLGCIPRGILQMGHLSWLKMQNCRIAVVPEGIVQMQALAVSVFG